MILPWLWLIGCGLSECRDLCAREADCVEQELDDYDVGWREWTGFEDRGAFEDTCLDVFEGARDLGASRRDVQRTCEAELERPCG